MLKLLTICTATTLFLFAFGCSPSETPAAPKQTTETADKTPATPAEPGSTKVAEVVFIGQKDACACTRTRVDDAWPVLEKALTGYDNIKVKRLQNDVGDEADRYDEMKTVMVAPGIFFMDKNDKMLDVLQGEVTQEQILAVLQK